MESIKEIVSILESSGPYAILVFLGMAYWRQQQYIAALHSKILDSSEKNAVAMTAMEKAVESLTVLIQKLL
jgi:hypothetical protein